MKNRFLVRPASICIAFFVLMGSICGLTSISASAAGAEEEIVYLRADFENGELAPFIDVNAMRGYASVNTKYNRSTSASDNYGRKAMSVYSYPAAGLTDENGNVFDHGSNYNKFGSMSFCDFSEPIENTSAVLRFSFYPVSGSVPNLNVCLLSEAAPTETEAIERTDDKAYVLNIKDMISLSSQIAGGEVVIDLNKQYKVNMNSWNEAMVYLDMAAYKAELYLNGMIIGRADINKDILPKIAGIQFRQEPTHWEVGAIYIDDVEVSSTPSGLKSEAVVNSENRSEVELTFDNPVQDPEKLSAADFSVLRAADEKPIAVSSVSAVEGKIILSLAGNVEVNTAYKVNMSDNVQSIFGGKLTEPAVLFIKGGNMQYRQVWLSDFEDGSAVNDNAPAPIAWNYVESQESSSGTYVKDDSGNTWYRLYGYYWNSALLYRDINPDITSGKHKFSFKLKVADNRAVENNIIDVDFSPSKESNTQGDRRGIWKIWGTGKVSASLDFGPGQNITNDTAVTAEDMKNGVTFTAIFDMDNHNAEYYANDTLIVRSRDEEDRDYSLSSIPQVRFNEYATDDGGDREFYIDDVKWETEMPPIAVKSVRFINIDGSESMPVSNSAVYAGATGVKIQFAGDASVGNGDVSLSGGGNGIANESFDSDTMTYTAEFSSPLAPDTDYSLSISDNVVEDGYIQNFTTDSGVYKASELSVKDGKFNYSVVNTTAESKAAYAAYAVYTGDDENGWSMSGFGSYSDPSFRGVFKDSDIPVTAAEGAKVKAFAWDSEEDMNCISSAFSNGSYNNITSGEGQATAEPKVTQTADCLNISGTGVSESVQLKIADSNGITRYIDQADGTGNYNFAIALPQPGEYTVYVNVDNGTIYEIPYVYMSHSAMNTAFAALFAPNNAENLASAEAFTAYCDANKYDLAFVHQLDTAQTHNAIFTQLYKEVKAAKPADSTELKVLYDKCVLIANCSNASFDNIYDYIGDYFINADEVIASASLRKVYKAEYISNAVQKSITDKFRLLAPKSVSEFDEALVEAFALGVAKSADGWGYVETALNAVGGELDLPAVVRASAQAVVGNNYNSISELKKAISEANKSNNNGGGGNSSGSSGGGVSNSKMIQSTLELPEPLEKKMQFNDLDSVEWAKDAILKLADIGIINGKGNDEFAPNDSITREEFTKIIVGAFIGEDSTDIAFNDVKSDEWYYPYIKRAFAAGIINGVSNTAFGIGSQISREDMAVIMYRTALVSGISLEDAPAEEFDDDSEIADYAKEAVYALRTAGFVNGVSENEFAPKRSLTRAEAAVIINRLLSAVQ